jgi:tripartite-type tricarboxylate transporter receptor subunit TctC
MKSLIAALLCAVAPLASAQSYPAKPVRFVVAFAPGGPADIIARLVGAKLGESWGQPVVVENRAGAGGNLATAAVAKAPADGYTVLVNTSALAVNASLVPDPGYDAHKDFAPVIVVASSPNIILAHPGSGVRTLADALALGRQKGLNYGSAGNGTTPHLSAEYLFKVLAKIPTTHVPYKGAGPALTAALGGEVPVVSVAMPPSVPHVKAGKLVALAVTSTKRVAVLPDVPTVAESGFPGFDDYTWVGLFLPAASPGAAVERLNAEVGKILAAPEVKERLASLGFEPVGGSRGEFARYLKKELAHWGRVVKETGAKAE